MYITQYNEYKRSKINAIRINKVHKYMKFRSVIRSQISHLSNSEFCRNITLSRNIINSST